MILCTPRFIPMRWEIYGLFDHGVSPTQWHFITPWGTGTPGFSPAQSGLKFDKWKTCHQHALSSCGFHMNNWKSDPDESLLNHSCNKKLEILINYFWERNILFISIPRSGHKLSDLKGWPTHRTLNYAILLYPLEKSTRTKRIFIFRDSWSKSVYFASRTCIPTLHPSY